MERLSHFQAFCVFCSIINVLCFLKIFRYLDTIVIKHINKILDLVGLHGENKYNCFVLWTPFISLSRLWRSFRPNIVGAIII